ncbi:hypothetical protein Tco_0198917 [Tanacetum coccineum]
MHIQTSHTVHSRTKRDGTIEYLDPNIIFLSELHSNLRSWEEIVCENAIILVGNRDHLNKCCAQPYNLAYYVVNRIENVKSQHDKVMPYGMLLTRLFHYAMSTYPHLAGPYYRVVDRKMAPIGGPHVIKPRSDKVENIVIPSPYPLPFVMVHHLISIMIMRKMMKVTKELLIPIVFPVYFTILFRTPKTKPTSFQYRKK